mmetsp:Transcript_58524/g.128464  ORF Transcript_58524/g.128464 Transcript_58524/m.128464 type:complete len:462 (+) Transcript_58524:803-2188(+)
MLSFVRSKVVSTVNLVQGAVGPGVLIRVLLFLEILEGDAPMATTSLGPTPRQKNKVLLELRFLDAFKLIGELPPIFRATIILEENLHLLNHLVAQGGHVLLLRHSLGAAPTTLTGRPSFVASAIVTRWWLGGVEQDDPVSTRLPIGGKENIEFRNATRECGAVEALVLGVQFRALEVYVPLRDLVALDEAIASPSSLDFYNDSLEALVTAGREDLHQVLFFTSPAATRKPSFVAFAWWRLGGVEQDNPVSTRLPIGGEEDVEFRGAVYESGAIEALVLGLQFRALEVDVPLGDLAALDEAVALCRVESHDGTLEALFTAGREDPLQFLRSRSFRAGPGRLTWRTARQRDEQTAIALFLQDEDILDLRLLHAFELSGELPEVHGAPAGSQELRHVVNPIPVQGPRRLWRAPVPPAIPCLWKSWWRWQASRLKDVEGGSIRASIRTPSLNWKRWALAGPPRPR